jgi:hypothetical protein
MNLEFMCCILYGLSDIFNKVDQRKRKRLSTFDVEDCTLNIVDVDGSNNLSKEVKFEKSHTKDKSLLPNELRK